MLPKNKDKIEEYKRNVSLRMKGNKNSVGAKRTKEHIEIIKKNNILRCKGKKHSLNHRKKMSVALSGDKNPAWKGGITNINLIIRRSLEYKLWREAVFERDNWTCIWCGVRSKKGVRVTLQADHIKPFSLFPALIDNDRTLCKDCHKLTDTFGWKIYNKKNYDKDYTYHPAPA